MDRKREARAETVARVENAIEDELLKRLQSGTYGDIYNFPMEQYNKVCSQKEKSHPRCLEAREGSKKSTRGGRQHR